MWNILAEGRCTVGEVLAREFDPRLYLDPQRPRRGRAYSLAAGQVPDAYRFDAGFFHISPREALQMDPQQRLMLHAVWEAIEDAGLNARELAGDRTGVFIGSSIVENLFFYYNDADRADSSSSLGNTLCVIANRVSSFFDFGGPSYAVDTACASGLYALHQAHLALARGEVDTAIVGAVSISRALGGFVGFSQARMLSPTGRCRAFSEDADGYVRSEACIALVMQRAEVAERMRSRARASLLATGVNSDGAASQLTVPSAPRQEALITRVLAESGLDPDDIDFFEAHGTGTQIGDPVEARSIGGAIGQLRKTPLRIGSAKTNFGHPEPAAGLLGVAKVLLSFENRALPASLHFTAPNPAIDFDDLGLEVNTTLHPLRDSGTLCAGLNSFGFGGTNASAVLRSVARHETKLRASAALSVVDTPEITLAGRWMLMSAASESSLRALAAAWADQLESAPHALWPELVAASAARTPLDMRLALPADLPLIPALRSFAGKEETPGAICERVSLHGGRTVLAFPGNGAQFPGMGRHEYETEPGFRAVFDEVAAAFRAHGVPDLVGLMHADDLAERLPQPIVAQPLLFAWQVAMARCLIARGLRLDATVGHSVGEIAALHLAGVLDLADATRIIATRSRAFEGLRGRGTMAAVAATIEEVDTALKGLETPDVAIAAINSPRSITLSGPVEAIDRLSRFSVGGKRLAMVKLKIDLPYHSPEVEPLRARFIADLAEVRFAAPALPVAGSSLGRMLGPGDFATGAGIDYLWRNARDPVRFADAIRALAASGPCHVVEISPAPVLGGNIRDIARFDGIPVAFHTTAPEKPRAADTIRRSASEIVAEAWARGLSVDLKAIAGTPKGPAPQMPPYPWDEQEFLDKPTVDALEPMGRSEAGPFAGRRTEPSSAVWMASFTPTAPAWLRDHKLGKDIVVPATALLEMACSAAADLWPEARTELRDFDIVSPALIQGDGLRIKTEIDPKTGALTLSGRPRLQEGDWAVIARGTLRRLPEHDATASAARGSAPRLEPAQDLSKLYDSLARLGLNYGPSFRKLKALRPLGRNAFWLDLAESDLTGRFGLDPSTLDACFHALAGLDAVADRRFRSEAGREFARMMRHGASLIPVRIGKVRLFQPGTPLRHARMVLRQIRRHSLVVTLTLHDAERNLIAELDGVEFMLVRLSAGRELPRSAVTFRTIRRTLPGATCPRPRGWARPAQVLGRLGQAGLPVETPLRDALGRFRRQLASPARPIEHLNDVLALAPDFVDDLRALMMAARGKEPRDVALHGFAQHHIWTEAERLLAELSRSWPKDHNPDLLLLGLPDAVVIRRILGLPFIGRLVLGAADEEGRALLRQVLPGDLLPLVAEVTPDDRFELMIGLGPDTRIDSLAGAHLAAGGMAFLIDTPDLRPGGWTSALPEGWDWVHRPDPRLPLRIAHQSGGAARPAEPPPLQVVATEKPLNPPYPEAPRPPLPAVVTSFLERFAPEEGARPGHRLLVHLHAPGDDPTKSLVRLLWQIRQEITSASKAPLVLLAVNLSDAASFRRMMAGLSALIRTLANEAPERSASLIGFAEPPASAEAIASLFPLLARERVMLLAGDRLEIERATLLETEPPKGAVLRLAQHQAGNLSSLGWDGAPRARPAAGELDIAVEAIGLNFRDVMLARGLLPERMLDEGASGAGLGMEFAGRVLARGRGCTLPPGARVMGFASSALANRLIVPEAAVALLPDAITAREAAGIPVPFVTAWEALIRLARIRKGESVLIHGGAGGVGLAAIQIARLKGLRIFATASTPEKRAIAMAFGAEAVFDSRSLGFLDEIRRATGGRGVDVVLNSLSGEAMQRSIECLAPFGRFVELGKRDYLEGTQIDLRPFLQNLTYFGYDLDRALAADPEAIRASMAEVREALARGELRPLPLVAFRAEAVEDAFRHMLAARHSGKIIVTPPLPQKAAPRPQAIRGDWVILGGTGGVGLSSARALLDAGAERVHLVSRSGEMTIGLGELEDWAQQHPGLQFHALDAGDADALAALLDRLESEGRQIQGIIHAAMMLRDRTIAEIAVDEAELVMRSKINVAIALDQVLRARAKSPEHVIFFSSIASVLGNPGQAAYSAANAVIEAIAAGRRRDGLPALTIGWGPVGDTGYLRRNPILARQLSKVDGLQTLSAEELTRELIAAIRHRRPADYCYAAADWERLAATIPALGLARMERLVPPGASRRSATGELAERLRALDWTSALALAEKEFRDIMASILRMSPDQYNPTYPLSRYGVDSLMAMELRMEVDRRFGCSLSTLSLSDQMTGARVAAALVARIRGEGEQAEDKGDDA